MFQHIRKIDGNVVALRITGEITRKEFEQLDRLMHDKAAQYGPLRLLIVVEHYPSFNSAEDLYEDLRFAKLHAQHIHKMAVVGDRAWKQHWVALFGLFSGIQSDYFAKERVEEAWQWVTTD